MQAFEKYIDMWCDQVVQSKAANQLEFYLLSCFGVYLNVIDDCMVQFSLPS